MAITRDQLSTVTIANTTGSSFTITFPTRPAAGASVLVTLGLNCTAAISSVKDNGTSQSTFTLDKTETGSASHISDIYRADGISLPSSGSYVVTVTLASSVAYSVTAGAASYLGKAPGGPVSTNAATATSTSVSTGNGTPNAAGSLFIATFQDNSGGSADNPTVTNANFTSQLTNGDGTSGQVFGFADQIKAASSADACTWTVGTSATYSAAVTVYPAAIVTRDQPGALSVSTGTTSLAVTWATNPTAGAKVLVSVFLNNATNIVTSVKDNGTSQSTFTLDQSFNLSGAFLLIYRADGISLPGSGSYVVTVTLSTSASVQAAGGSYLGVRTGAPTHVNTDSGTGTSVSTGSVTPAAAGALYFAAFTDQSTLSSETITLTGPGFTEQATETNGSTYFAYGLADKIDPGGPTATACTWTLGDSVAWTGHIVVYDAALSVTTTSLPPADPGAAYAYTLTATGGTTPYTWSISSGSLPGWASLNTSTGAITGTPMITDVGSTTFTAEVTDNASLTATQPLTLIVLPLAAATSAVPGRALPGFSVPGVIIVTGLAATAGLAAATGTAYNPVAQVTALPSAALGTGTAYNPVAQVTAKPSAALGTGTAYNPVAQVTVLPAAALGTGTAYNPVAQVTVLPAAALGTGTAYLAGWGPGTAAALGTGTAYNPVAQVTAKPSAALGTGTAYNPVAQITALPAAALGTGTAYNPVAQVTALPTAALGTGAAYNPVAQVTALPTAALGTGAAYNPVAQITALPGAATGTGAAYQPALGPATAAGTAVAYQPGWGPGTTTAAGTGAALKPGWGPGTTAAAGTGAAYNPVAQVTAKPAAALGTGAAYNPVAQVTALPAAALGTGAAYAPFISYTAGAALGTGAAGKPGWGPGTTTAAGTGAAYNPVAQVTAFDQTGALGTGTAYNVPFHADNTVFPGVAAGTGNTYLAGWGPVYDISAATGTAYGGDTAPGFAQVTALPGAALGTGAAYVLTAGFAPGTATASGDVFQPYISYTAGAALGTAAAGKPGWGPVAGVAAGTGAGYTVALVKLTVFPGAAPATAVAYGTVELSPALEGYGFGTFPQVPNGAIILSVVANVVWTGSNTGIQAPAYELWNGVSARIGAPVTGVASTTAGHRDSVVFTGVVYSQLATLRLRVYAASLLSNAGATASFDAVSLSVVWAPNTNAATAPVTLTVVPVFPAVSVSNGITITPAVAAAAGTAYQPVGTGNIGATALPGVLVIIPVFPAVRISIGQTITPGVLAIVPLLPLIIDITGPGWAASDDQPVGGTGSWVNPGNITGPPDGSVAVWTSV